MDKEHFNPRGWRKQQPDQRDFRFDDYQLRKAVELPASVDLSKQILRVKDQGQLGSCVAHGVTSLFETCQVRLTGKDFLGDRLYEYRNARILSGTYPGDNGADVRGGVKATAQYGVCPETDWAYNIAQFDNTPPAQCAKDAVKNEATNYYLLDSTAGSAQSLLNIKTALASGYCVVFGSTVYDSIFNVGSDGIIPYPSGNDPIAGGHCMLWYGYTGSYLMTLNSWGYGWGNKGFGLMDTRYVTNKIASDFWTIIAESEITPTPPPSSDILAASTISVVNV
jgi:C1A family cysteine protease